MRVSRVTRLLAPLLLATCVASCVAPRPRPMAEWEVARHPLYPPAVWVETGAGTRGGGVVVASTPECSWILTAWHVVKDGSALDVGAFRHSLAAPSGGAPEYVLYPAELVAGGYVFDDSVREPFAAVVVSLRRLVAAAGGAGRFPTLERLASRFAGLTERLDAARTRAAVFEALDGFLAAGREIDAESFGPELASAAERASAASGDPDAGLDHARAVTAAMAAASDAVRQVTRGETAVVMDVALLRVRTPAPLACARLARGGRSPGGAEGVIVTIQPEGEPRAQPVRVGGDLRITGTALMSGAFRHGNSGSPVFVDGGLAGIATAGLIPGGDGPGDAFTEGVFLRAGTIRHWMERNGLGPALE